MIFPFLAIFPCVTALLLARDISSEWNKHIDLDISGQNLFKSEALSITCAKCTVIGDVSLSGGDGAIDYNPDANFSQFRNFDFEDPWAGAVVEDFTVYMDFDFVLTPKNKTNEIIAELIPPVGIIIPQTYGILKLDWKFNPIIHGWVNSSSPANFSYGFQFHTLDNSAVLLSLNSSNSTNIGFNQSQLTPLNYSSSDAHDDFNFELSFRPVFEVTGEIFGIIPTFSAEVFADVPKLDVAVTQVSNVTSKCEAAPPNTPSRQIFSGLTHVVPWISYDIGLNGSIFDIGLGTTIIPVGANDTLPTACLQYIPSESSLVAADESNQASFTQSAIHSKLRAILGIMLWCLLL